MLNQNPHYLGSAGYSGKKAEWAISDPLSSQPDFESISLILERAGRSLDWVRARIKKGKDGKYYIPNNKTTATLEKIVEKCEEISQGSFQSNRQKDILAAVLDNKKGDRGGYVRGVGVYTNVRDVFGKPDKPRERSGGIVSVDDLRDLIKRDMYSDIKNEVYLEIKNEVYSEIKNEVFLNLKDLIKNEVGSDKRKGVYLEGSPQTVQMHFEPPRYTRSSVYSVDPVQFDLIEDPIQCRLAVLINGESTKVIARGMIYRSATDTLVHNEPLLPNHVKVMVDEIVDGADEFTIPVSVQHHTRVGEIVGSFAQWPIHLVGIGEEDIIINKTCNASSNEKGDLSTTGFRPPLVDDDHLERLGDNAKKLHTLLRRIPHKTEYLEVVLDPDIFHHTNMSYIFVSIEGTKDLFSMGWIDVSIIQIFIRYLHKLCMSIGNNSIGFMCPSRISKASIAQNVDAVTTYLFKTMCTLETKTLILAPYHQDNHWLLLVILANAIPRSVYVLDPIKCDRDLAIKPTLNTSFRMLSDHQGLRAILPNWTYVTCPQQPGVVECGYYVMRYMLEICTKYPNVNSLTEVSTDANEYPPENLDDIRNIWIDYFLNECM